MSLQVQIGKIAGYPAPITLGISGGAGKFECEAAQWICGCGLNARV